jgi:c-di-GMP-binding flagellar brake protein YcgR
MLTGKKVITGEIKDISLGGALIRCQEVLSRDESLELKIEITDLFSVSATVENVRCHIDESHRDPTTCYLAVRFTDMTKDQSRILNNAIARETRGQGR